MEEKNNSGERSWASTNQSAANMAPPASVTRQNTVLQRQRSTKIIRGKSKTGKNYFKGRKIFLVIF